MNIIKPVLLLTKIWIEADKTVGMNDNVTITVGIAEGSDFGCVVEFGDESMEFLKETKTDYYENGPVWDFTSFR